MGREKIGGTERVEEHWREKQRKRRRGMGKKEMVAKRRNREISKEGAS